MPSKPPTRAVPKPTDSLRAIGQEVYETDAQGRSITRKEKLDRILWQEATGWVEQKRDTNGTLHEVTHPPNIAVALKLKEQLDGKAATAAPPEIKGMTVAQQVRALAVERLNRFADKQLPA